MLRLANYLIGSRVHGSDGGSGHVHDLYFDEHSWGVRHVVVDTGYWLAGRHVVVSPQSIVSVNWSRREFETLLTGENTDGSHAVKRLPAASSEHHMTLDEYFNVLFFWTSGDLVSPVASTVAGSDGCLADNSYLHSVRGVLNYSVRAADAEVGHVRDVVIDDQSWAVNAILVDRRRQLSSDRLIIPSGSVESISWPELSMRVRPTMEDAHGSHRPGEDTGRRVRIDRRLRDGRAGPTVP